ncbi:MAG: HAD-IIA family hydrolase [Armatimonadetes bacterium]|nr:HAD-IIA family hydrolase [Armatimonadota bacterium]
MTTRQDPPPAKCPAPAASLDAIAGFLLDLDGTCYVGDRAVPGAAAFVARCRAQGRRVLWVTNNCSRRAAEYAAKLNRLGFAATPEDVFTSGEATTLQLRGEGVTRVFLLGTPSLEREFQDAGLTLTAEDPQRVVVAFDLGVTYEKLKQACRLVRAGVPFVATHPDLNCPTEEGPIPDCGALCALITAATGVSPQVIGKPHAGMAAAAARRLGLPPHQIAMVGDRLYTDIRMAVENGMTGILVLSGEATIEDLRHSPFQPHLVVSSLADLLPAETPSSTRAS